MTVEASSDEALHAFQRAVAAGQRFKPEEPVEICAADLRMLYVIWGRGVGGKHPPTVPGKTSSERDAAAALLPSGIGAISPAGIIIDGGRHRAITIVGEPDGGGA